MSDQRVIAAKYAWALMQVALEKGQGEAVRQDLALVVKLYGAGDGQALLTHPQLENEKKIAQVETAVGQLISPPTLSLLRLLIVKRRGGLLTEIAEVFEEQWNQRQALRQVKVLTALPLNAGQTEKLRQQLAELTGMQVELTQEIDPSLKAGARLVIGDQVFDGSLAHRLEQLRKALSAN